jgi:putative endonuclease
MLPVFIFSLPSISYYGMMERIYYVYIMTNKPGGTLYVGITNDIARRVEEHKSGLVKGFTEKYKLHILVYCESYPTAHEAIAREKQIKEWHRNWKIRLIKTDNPEWKDILELI